uniref:Uncharacterized protein n=1 Tax=Panagrolaimus davidi TaxID=227884 RepID=A0A914R4R1_9BILA
MSTNASKNSFLAHIASVAQNEIIVARIKIVEEANKCLGKSYSIEEVVDSGFIPFLIECIKMPDKYLQERSTAVLQRIADENFKYCQIMVDDGIVPVLIEMLNYKSNADEQDMFYILLVTLLDRQIFDECIKLGLHEKLCRICEKTTFSWPLAELIGICYPNQELLYCVKRYIFSLKEFSSFNNDGMLEGISHILDYLC